MISPALPAIGRDLNITNSSELALTLSIFVLAYAIGPLFLAPISEILGRAIVLQLANGVYIIFNTCCGFAKSEGEMIGFRVLAGLGGSAAVIGKCLPWEHSTVVDSRYWLGAKLRG